VVGGAVCTPPQLETAGRFGADSAACVASYRPRRTKANVRNGWLADIETASLRPAALGGSMRRDRRLLIAMLLFFGSLVAGLVQAFILRAYVAAAVLGDWTYFADTFSVGAPASGPDGFCFDYCAPDLPFVSGWTGIASFLAGLILLAYAWWKPRSSGSK
jgi:hypothetical protein